MLREKQILKEKIRQKSALIDHLKLEIQQIYPGLVTDKERYVFLLIKERLESQIERDFDPVLSRKIDCVNFLLEN